ncbi:MAG TPA: IclR family transcriptional regulator [Tepidisphaeraceae bacterium]|nr:IclR family transcriptional regulator [Tepidisphaeraceae bacterium]
MALIEALAGQSAPLGLADLAASCGISRPTTHRLLQLLKRLGYVDGVARGSYQLTDKLRHLAIGVDERSLVRCATPILQALRNDSRETVNLGVLKRDRVCYLAVLESSHALRRAANPGETDPFYCTALGRVLAAALPQPRRRDLLAACELTRRTPRTVIDPDSLSAILEEVHRAGYAVEQDQTDLGVTCLSAPVLQEGRVIAAVSISAASARLDDAKIQKLVGRVRHAARQISAEVSQLSDRDENRS